VQNVRARFEKSGRAKYISHLDLTRCFSRAFAMAKLPVWFTEGFNRHLYMTFALPLPLGFESSCETVDFRFTQSVDFKSAADTINKHLPEGIHIKDISEPLFKADSIYWADDMLSFDCSGDCAGFPQDFESFCGKDEIKTIKKTKGGEREIDLKGLFSVLSAEKDGEEYSCLIRFRAGGTLNINPNLLLTAFESSQNPLPPVKITRCAIRLEDMREFA